MKIEILKQVLYSNNAKANEIRKLLNKNNIFMINLIGSPGSGKTSLIEKCLHSLDTKIKIAIIEGDIATDRDAKRLISNKTQVVMINTEGECHLNCASIEKAIESFDLNQTDLIIIENIGNLVCPSEFDLGEDIKIAVSSTTEGEDKPAKYPHLFRQAELIILNKIDLEKYISFNKSIFYHDLHQINREVSVIETSCTTNQGIDDFSYWLLNKIKSIKVK